MTNKTKPTEIEDADLDVAGGLSPDMKIRTAATAGTIDGVRKNDIRVGGNPINGVRQRGIRVTGVHDKG